MLPISIYVELYLYIKIKTLWSVQLSPENSGKNADVEMSVLD